MKVVEDLEKFATHSLERYRRIYSGPHERVPANLSEFPHLEPAL